MLTSFAQIVNMHPTVSVVLSRRSWDDPPPSDNVAVSVDDGLVPSASGVVGPLDTRGQLDIPIPWCRSREEFLSSRLALQFIVRVGPGYGAYARQPLRRIYDLAAGYRRQ